jgi:hypothetical protein
MRLLSAAVVSAALLIGLAAPTTQAGQPLPTLGSTDYPGPGFPGPFPGFGTVAPKVVSANGDPNSIVSKLHWTGWGHREAKGFGASYEFAPRGGYLPGLFPVQLRASDLGRCTSNGPTVYRRLRRRDRIDGGTKWSAWSAWPDISYPHPQLLC